MRRGLALAIALALSIAACGRDDHTATAPATTAATVADRSAGFQRALDAHRDWYGSPGVIAAAEIGGQHWSGSSGAADLDGTPITADTRFRIASITKAVVAALVLDAVDRGELALDDPVDEWLSGMLRVGPPVTVRMLLDHTSGVFAEGDEGNPIADVAQLTDPVLQAEAAELAEDFAAGEPVLPSVELLVALAETHDRYAPPGAGYHYSNINFMLAAMVLERATDTTLAELLEERIAAPLGLHHTTVAPADSSKPEFRGTTRATPDDELVDPSNAHLLMLGNGGSGGIISTADELLTIVRAIVAGELLPAALVDEMLRPTAQSGAQAYGLGIAKYSLTCGTFYGHQGAIDGTMTIAIVSPTGDDGVVLAVNARDDSTDPRLPALADDFLCGAPR